MSDPADVGSARRALGRRLAELRQAAGYNQHQFAPLTCYGRSTIANVETGRQQVPRVFWERCDKALDTGDTLALAADQIAALVRQRRAPALDAARRGSAPPQALPGEPFEVESHKFVPAYLGALRARELVERLKLRRSPHAWLDCHVVPLQTEHGACGLYIFDCGVAVFHLRERCRSPSVSDLAAWRWTSYRAVLRWTGRELERLLRTVGQESVDSEYVLSLYWLLRPSWTWQDLDTAVRLLSVPSVLVDRVPTAQLIKEGRAAEQTLFQGGFRHPDLVPFGVQGVSVAYASWSGVAYHPLAADRALSTHDLVSWELTVQALWCYCQRVITEVEEGRDPSVPPEDGWRFVRAAHSRLTNARALESSQHRLMREAIVSTSGLPARLSAAQEILRECETVTSGSAS